MRYRRCLALAALMFAAVSALGQDAGAVRPLTQGDDVLALPSFARMLMAFAIAVGLAVGVTFLMKRFLPKMTGQWSASSRLRVLDRISLQGSTRVHFLQVDASKVLVAESRHGIAVTVIQSGHEQEPPSVS